MFARAWLSLSGALLQFRLNGMVTQCGDGIVGSFAVEPATPFAVLLIQDGPEDVIIAGNEFEEPCSGNLVDMYNNSITEEGWFMHLSASGFRSPSGAFGNFEVKTCVDEACTIYDPVFAVAINDASSNNPSSPGIAVFVGLMMQQAGSHVRLKMTAGRSSDSSDSASMNPEIVPALSSPFVVLANALDNLDIWQAPRTESWVTSDNVPKSATAGIPFQDQPRVAFVDTFSNAIEALNRNAMSVALMGRTAGGAQALIGTTTVLSDNGIVSFTDLQIKTVGTYWLRFTGSGFIVYSVPFEVVHGRAASVEFIRQPGNMARGVPFAPQPLGELKDPYGNMVELPYTFKARIWRTRRDGSTVPTNTHVTCPTCGGFYESHNFKSEQGYIHFDGLAVILDPDGPENEFGIALQLIAVNLTTCEKMGESTICGPETEYIHGRQVYGLSDYFDIFSLTTLFISAQPADTNASLPILGQEGGNDAFPRVELRGTFRSVLTGNSLFHAAVSHFKVEALLYYEGGDVGSQCLQGNSQQQCLGTCESHNALCDRKCAKDLGYSGRQFTSFSGDDSTCTGDDTTCKYADDAGKFDPLYKGVERNADANKEVCSYRAVCEGVGGNATCNNLRINRAGTYYLLFRVWPCGLLSDNLPWVRNGNCAYGEGAGEMVQAMSRVFTIHPLASKPGFLLSTCPKCVQPTAALVHAAFEQQPVVQLVDPSGNPVANGMFYVTVKVPSLANCTNVQEDPITCLPEAGRSFTDKFDFMPMQDCDCLEGHLTVPVINGYAKFTDLRITKALRRVRLIFYSSNDLHNFSSTEFAVQPRSAHSMEIRQQPLVGQAGELLHFELGLFDHFGFVSELDSHTRVHASLKSSTPGGAEISCAQQRGSCQVATSRAGFVFFTIVINQTGTNFTLSFRGNFCGLGPCDDKVVMSNNFTVLSSAPARLVITDQPSDVESQVPMIPAPKVMLIDTYANLLSEHLPAWQASLVATSKVGCDSIKLQLWCDDENCSKICKHCPDGAAAAISGLLRNGSRSSCCAILETMPGNNDFGCEQIPKYKSSQKHMMMHNASEFNETHRTNIFRAELLNISAQAPKNVTRYERQSAHNSDYSPPQGESTGVSVTPNLLGTDEINAIPMAVHEGMTVDAVGDYRIRFISNRFSVMSEAFHTTWSPSSNLHIIRDDSSNGYLKPLDAGHFP